MSKLPSMPFFPADFFADTMHMDGEEQGIYLVMLAHAWLRDGKLPADEKELLKLLRIHGNRWNRIKKNVLPFWHTQESYIFNRRITRNLQEIASKIDTNKTNGKLGGRPHKLLFSNGSTKANGFDFETQKKGNQNQNYIKDSFNGELRQESRWVPTKRIGLRLFKAGERAPAYDGQPPANWKVLKPEDCM